MGVVVGVCVTGDVGVTDSVAAELCVALAVFEMETHEDSEAEGEFVTAG